MLLDKVTVLPDPTFLSEKSPVALIVTVPVSPASIPIPVSSIPDTSTVAPVNPSYTLFDAVIPVTVTDFAVMSAVVLA